MIEPEVLFELADGVFGDPATQPVVGFDHVGRAEQGGDVGDHRVEPPSVEIVEAELVTVAGGLTTHDQTKCPPVTMGLADRDRRVGDLGALVCFGVQRRRPHRVRIGRERDRGSTHVVVLGCGHGEHRAELLGSAEHVVLIAGRVDPHPQIRDRTDRCRDRCRTRG
ncbi:MAG: hypothetical protein R2743_16775 [Ilumatobacteraceae bacterium]